jgi:kallikrein
VQVQQVLCVVDFFRINIIIFSLYYLTLPFCLLFIYIIYRHSQLIAPDIIITAAHCSQSFGEVQLGRHNIKDPNETYESLVVEQIVTHPHYYRDQFLDVDPYDLALVKVYGQSSNANAPLANINRDGRLLQKDQDLRVLGWGLTDPADLADDQSKYYSDVLRETNVQYIPNEDCRKVVGFHRGYEQRYEQKVIDVTLCAMNFENLTDSCRGDSGGPLLVLGGDEETDDDDLLVGITSSGYGCANPTLPAFYARISKAYEWIDEVVCQLSLTPPAAFNCTRSSSSSEEFEKYPVDCSAVPVVVSASGSNLSSMDVDVLDCTPKEPNVTLHLELALDGKPEERGWILQSKNSRGMFVTFAERPIFSYADIAPQSNVTEEFQLPNNREYVFTILDAFGDGSTPYIDPSFSLLEAGGDEQYSFLMSDPKVPFFRFRQIYELTIGTPPAVVPAVEVETAPPSSDESRPYLTIVIHFDNHPENTGFFLEKINNDDTRDLIQTVYPGAFGRFLERQKVTERVYLLPPAPEIQKYRFTMTDNEGNGLYPTGRYEAWLGNRHTGELLFQGGKFYLEAVHTFELEANFVFLPITLAPTESPGSTPTEPEISSGQNFQRPFCTWHAAVLSTILLTFIF